MPEFPENYTLAIYELTANGNQGAYSLGRLVASDLTENDEFTFYPENCDGFALVVIPSEERIPIENEDGLDVAVKGQLPEDAEISVGKAEAPTEFEVAEAYDIEISGTDEEVILEFNSSKVKAVLANGATIAVYTKNEETGEYTILEKAKVRDGVVSAPVKGIVELILAIERPDAVTTISSMTKRGSYSVSVDYRADSGIRGSVTLRTSEIEAGTNEYIKNILKAVQHFRNQYYYRQRGPASKACDCYDQHLRRICEGQQGVRCLSRRQGRKYRL